MSRQLQPGDRAPPFELWDAEEHPVHLADLTERAHLLLVFLGHIARPSASRRVAAIETASEGLTRLDVAPIGIVLDPPEDLAERSDSIRFRLLADEDHQMAEDYGAWGLHQYRGKHYLGVRPTVVLLGPERRVLGVWTEPDPADTAAVVIRLLEGGVSDEADDGRD